MTEALDLIFSALADPTRRAILERLAAGARSVTELSEPFAISGPAITKHLKVLEEAGLIKRSRIAQKRPCELQAEPLRVASDWIESYREHWEQSLDRLDNYLQGLQEKQKSTQQKKDDPHGKSPAVKKRD